MTDPHQREHADQADADQADTDRADVDKEQVNRAQANQADIDALWDFDEPAASEARLKEAADRATGQRRAVLMTQVARATGLQSRFDEAMAILDALPTGGDPETEARSQLERGRVLNSSGKADAALPLFEGALATALPASFEFLAIDALHMLAIVAPPLGQDALNDRALQLADAAHDPRARAWRSSLLNNMGWTAFDRQDYDAALGRFEAALAACEEQGDEARTRIARWCVARTLRAQGRVEEALAIQLALAAEHRAAGTSDAYVDEEIKALQAEPGRP